jgi:chemotaxis protein MotA
MIGTVYGVIFSNLVFKPVASKLEQRMLLRVAMMNVLLDGVLQMRLGRNAGTIEDALHTLVRTHSDEIRGRAA